MEHADGPTPGSPASGSSPGPEQDPPSSTGEGAGAPPPLPGGPPAGPPAPRTTTTPSEYTPTFLVQAYDVTLNFISAELGCHMYQVFQEMRADAEGYAKQHKEKPKRVLAQLVGEVKDWRHIPVDKGDSATILDQEVEAVRAAVPNLMNAVEDALRTGAIFLSGARGASAEGVTVRVPALRDFVNEVYVRVAKEYSGRNGTSRLYRHLTVNKDKLIAEVRHAASAALFPRESVWGAPEDLGKSIAVPPPPQPGADPALSRKTIPLGGEGPGPAAQATAARPEDSAKEEDQGFKNEELPEGGSDSGSASEDDGF